MSESKLHRLQVLSTDDPLFSEVATMVVPPPVDPEGKGAFFPAHVGFDIGTGSQVDVSWLYVAAGAYTPRRGFDRHLYTDELFIATEGDFYFPAAPCRNPDDPNDVPRPEDFGCWRINEGDMFILKPNVYHDGCWPVDETKMAKFIMILSGHRASDAGDLVDHYRAHFEDDSAGIIVDIPEKWAPDI